MNETLPLTLLLVQLAMAVGLLFSSVSIHLQNRRALANWNRVEDAPDQFWERRKRKLMLTGFLLVELMTAGLSLVYRPAGLNQWLSWQSVMLLGLIWFATFRIRLVENWRLTDNRDHAAARRIGYWDAVRIGCWSLRVPLLIFMLGSYLLTPTGSSDSTNSASISGLHVGETAPDFRAETFEGNPISLADYRGSRGVILFFYPRDGTSVCTKEACAFRDAYEKFVDAGFEVIGISSDSAESHRKFSQEHRLSYPLISDVDGSLRRAYSVTDTLGLIPKRVTFVIDKQGVIRLIFSALLASNEHVEQALRALNETR